MLLSQEYTGRLTFHTHHPSPTGELHVAVPIRLDGLQETHFALLDTAAPWCMLPHDLADLLGLDDMIPSDWGERDAEFIRLHTRFGVIAGRYKRLTITLPAEEGDELEVDATFFLSEDWQGPIVLGWSGFLERISFAVDPDANWLYHRAAGVSLDSTA